MNTVSVCDICTITTSLTDKTREKWQDMTQMPSVLTVDTAFTGLNILIARFCSQRLGGGGGGGGGGEGLIRQTKYLYKILGLK